jgi:hypothetical protein
VVRQHGGIRGEGHDAYILQGILTQADVAQVGGDLLASLPPLVSDRDEILGREAVQRVQVVPLVRLPVFFL